MSTLVQQLKSDHLSLKHALKRAADFTVPAIDRVTILRQAKTALLRHLDKENRELYPKLRAEAETDPALQATLDAFASEMEDVAAQALEFFDKYHDPAVVAEQLQNNIHYSSEFGGDLERLLVLLGLRIGREERTLYSAYDRIASKSKAA